MREDQPKGTHLAHDVPTLNPEGYRSFPPGSTPWSGGEAGKTQYLDPNINLKTQPRLEEQYIGALADENFDLMKKIDQEMLDKNIRSTILLRKVIELIKSKNFSINNIDINIIAQKPKIKKYSKKMILVKT